MILFRPAAFALAALLAGIGLASATMYAAPPPSQDEGHPGAGGGYEQAYVTARVNVRSKPSARARIVNRLRLGDAVNVGECRGGWCYVDAYGGSGWVSGRFIGRGANPYQPPGPAGPGIPPQEPGTGGRTPGGTY